MFVGNRWGVARQIEDILPEIAADHRVRVFGRGWAESALAPFDEGPLDYDRLVDAYNSATLVVDDTAGPTLPYGSVNSRVFDSLASGALVVSDNEVGVRSLFGERFPVATDADQLRAVLDWIDREPAAAGELQASLREEVLERHTYRHRSEEVRDHLLGGSRRTAMRSSWEHQTGSARPSWGDYHFARASSASSRRGVIRHGSICSTTGVARHRPGRMSRSTSMGSAIIDRGLRSSTSCGSSATRTA